MEKSGSDSESIDQFNSEQIKFVSNRSQIELFDDSSTQDVTEFNYSSDSANDDIQHSINNSGKIPNQTINDESTNDSQVLKVNVSNYFKDCNQTNIMSPVSELAMNVALTKLFSADHLTGKFESQSIFVS